MADVLTPTYLDKKVHASLRRAFRKENPCSLLLQQLFSHDTLAAMVTATRTKYKQINQPLLHQYGSAQVSKQLRGVLENESFVHLLSSIIGRQVSIRDAELLRFSWKDYTVLNDHAIDKPGVDLIIDLTPTWDASWGGVVTYVDGKGSALVLAPQAGSCTIVERSSSMHRFVQYVNHISGNRSRMLITARLELL